MGLGRHNDSNEELIEFRDYLSELASGYLERYGRDEVYYSLINTVDTIHDKLNH